MSMKEKRGLQSLTPREWTVWESLSRAGTLREVAERLGISKGSLWKHKASLQYKTECGTRAELAALYLREMRPVETRDGFPIDSFEPEGGMGFYRHGI